jgi:hypothetical protein
MQTLAPHFSDEGRRALSDVSAGILGLPGARELIERSAREIALMDDDEAAGELRQALRDIEQEIIGTAAPDDLRMVPGFVFTLGELIVSRFEEIKAHGGHA